MPILKAISANANNGSREREREGNRVEREGGRGQREMEVDSVDRLRTFLRIVIKLV